MRVQPAIVAVIIPGVCLTDRASAAATCPFGHYLTFLKPQAPASCMRLLDSSYLAALQWYRPIQRILKPSTGTVNSLTVYL
jgi:hypothetical protein